MNACLLSAPDGGEFKGVADVRYCLHNEGSPLGNDPGEGRAIEGNLLGLVIKPPQAGVVRVHLPDGEVYDLDSKRVRPAQVNANHVPV